MHLMAIAALFGCSIATHWVLLAGVAFALHGLWRVWCDALRQNAGAVIALEISDETRCRIFNRGGAWSEGQVLATTHVTPWLIVVHVAITGRWRARSVLIMSDALAPDAYRRLCVRLRWARYERDARAKHGGSL